MSQVNLEQLIKKAMAENQSFRHCRVTKPGQIATVSINGKTVKAICPTVVTGNAVAIKLASPYNGIEWVVVGSHTSGQISSQTLDDRRSSPQSKTEPVDRFDPDGFILYGKWSDEPVVNPPINNSESSWALTPLYNVVGEGNKKRQYFVEYPHKGGEYATKEDAENDEPSNQLNPEQFPPIEESLEYGMYYIGSQDSLNYDPYTDYEYVSGPNVSKADLWRTPVFRFGQIEYTMGQGGVPVTDSFLTPWFRGTETRGSISAYGGFSPNWKDIASRYDNMPKRGRFTFGAQSQLSWPRVTSYRINDFGNPALYELNDINESGAVWEDSGQYIGFGIIYNTRPTPLPGTDVIFFKRDPVTLESLNAKTNSPLGLAPGTILDMDFGQFQVGYWGEPSSMSIWSAVSSLFWDEDAISQGSPYFAGYGQNLSSGFRGGLFLLIGVPIGQSSSGIAAQIKSHWGLGGNVVTIIPQGGLNNGDGGGGGGERPDPPPEPEPEIEKIFLEYKGYVENLYVRDFAGEKEIKLPIGFRAFCVNQPEDYESVIGNNDDDLSARQKYITAIKEELMLFGTSYSNIEYKTDRKILSLEPYFLYKYGIGFTTYKDFIYDKRPAISHSYSPHLETRETYLAGMDEDRQYLYVYVLYGLSINDTTIQWQKEDADYYLSQDLADLSLAEKQAVADFIDNRNSQRLIDTCLNPGCLGYNHLRCFKIKKASFAIELDITYNYPTVPPETMRGASGYIFDAFSRYTMGSETIASGDTAGTDPRFIHARVNASTLPAVNQHVPLGTSIYYRCTLPGVEFTRNEITGQLYGCSKESIISFYDNGGHQKQHLLYYGFPALQKYIRDDLPVTYGALGLQPSTRGVAPSHELWKTRFNGDNHCKPKSLWSDTEKSWYSLTLEPKEISYFVDTKDRSAESYFHHIVYGNKNTFALTFPPSARRFALYFQFINSSFCINITYPGFTDVIYNNSGNLGGLWDTWNVNLITGVDYFAESDGLSFERNQHFAPMNSLWGWYLDTQLTEQERENLLEWQNAILGVQSLDAGLIFGSIFQAKDLNESINFSPVSSNDYLTVLPFFCNHNTNRNLLISVSNNDTEWTQNTIYLKLKSNFVLNFYLNTTNILPGSVPDSSISKIPGSLHANSLILSHTAVYRETFLDKNSNLFLNTDDEFRVPLTRCQKQNDTIVSVKSSVQVKGLNIPYLGDEGGGYTSEASISNPSTYLPNIKNILLQQVQKQEKILPPLWAGRLWHFMPINKG